MYLKGKGKKGKVHPRTGWEGDPVFTVQRRGTLPGLFGRVRKISPPPLGFDPRTVQPVASRYTDRAIAAHEGDIWGFISFVGKKEALKGVVMDVFEFLSMHCTFSVRFGSNFGRDMATGVSWLPTRETPQATCLMDPNKTAFTLVQWKCFTSGSSPFAVLFRLRGYRNHGLLSESLLWGTHWSRRNSWSSSV